MDTIPQEHVQSMYTQAAATTIRTRKLQVTGTTSLAGVGGAIAVQMATPGQMMGLGGCPADGGGLRGSNGSSSTGQTISPKPRPASSTRAKAACLADVAINFGLGFVPGVNAMKLGLDLLGVNLHPVASMTGDSKAISIGPGILTPLSGVADVGRVIAHTSFDSRGGKSALMRATELAERASFSGKSAAAQARLLGDVASLTKLARVVSVAGGVANLLNAASAAADAYACVK